MSFSDIVAKAVYNTAVQFYFTAIKVAATHDQKAKKWVEGRKNLFHEIEMALQRKEEGKIWVHCSSLGEFEQGRPVIEQLKKLCPEKLVILTFFSPSGFEIRKNYELADHVFYLPEDTASNARKFIELVKPALVIFIKYEFWYHYFRELQNMDIPLLIVSAIFRKEQPFFNFYGRIHRKMLQAVTHFFVQNESSVKLLNEIGLSNITLINDTRVDRVAEIARSPRVFGLVKEWKKREMVIIGGSTYKAEEELLHKLYLSGNFTGKIIVAPHQVDKYHIKEICKRFGNKCILFSELSEEHFDKEVLVIDSMGILSSLYQYSDIALIGGGFGKNIHNVLEPAAFSQPVLFGPNYTNFQEAIELVEFGGAYEITDYNDFEERVKELMMSENWVIARRICDIYIRNHTGGTQVVMDYIKGLLTESPRKNNEQVEGKNN